MADRYKFQFSLPDDRITRFLQAIPKPYRALFVEMALDAWFSEKNRKDGGKLSLDSFTQDKEKESAATRIRVTISNKAIICGLRAISRKRRSFVAELALSAWMESKPGKVAFEMLTSRNRAGSQDPVGKPLVGDETAAQSDEFFRSDGEEVSDTERLIKSALAFEKC